MLLCSPVGQLEKEFLIGIKLHWIKKKNINIFEGSLDIRQIALINAPLAPTET